MSLSFVSRILHKKQQRKLKIKITIIAVLVFGLLYCIVNVAGTIGLKYSVKNMLDGFNKNGVQVKYQLFNNILTGEVFAKDVNFQVANGSAGCKSFKIKKTAGFLAPSEVNIKTEGIFTTVPQNDNIYTIVANEGSDGLYVKLSGGIFSKSQFAGIKIKSPVMLNVMNGEKVAGEIRIDKFLTIIDGQKKYVEYKGSMMFHDNAFVNYVFLLDVPFKWDTSWHETKTNGYVGLDKSKIVEITNTKVDRFFMDFDFSKLSAKGELSYTSQLVGIDMEVNIENDSKLLDNIINAALRTKSDAMQQIKKLHSALKSVIPTLKKNSEKSTKDNLQLFIKRTDIMPDYSINDIALTELAVMVGKLMK